jgi:hypothetical protein
LGLLELKLDDGLVVTVSLSLTRLGPRISDCFFIAFSVFIFRFDLPGPANRHGLICRPRAFFEHPMRAFRTRLAACGDRLSIQ